jgi:hypothetical protein
VFTFTTCSLPGCCLVVDGLMIVYVCTQMAEPIGPGGVQLAEAKAVLEPVGPPAQTTGATPASLAVAPGTFAPTTGVAGSVPPPVVVAGSPPVAVVATPVQIVKLPLFGYMACFVATAAAALFIIAITSNEMVSTDQVVGITGLDGRVITLYG